MKVSTLQKHIEKYGMSPISKENEEAINEYTYNLSAYDNRVYKRLLLAFNNYYLEFEVPRKSTRPVGASAWLR